MRVRHNKPSVILGLALVIPAVACGSDDNKKKTDGGIVVHDTGPGIDTAPACPIADSFSPTFTDGSNSQAINLGAQLGAGTQADRWVGVLGTAQTDPELNIIILSDGSAADTPDWPTLALGPASNLPLDPAAPDYLTEIAANFDAQGQPADTYAGTGGTLNITAAGSANGSTFSGNITNATFTHGTFDMTTGAFTPSADGCTATIANMTFTAALGSGAFAPSDTNGYNAGTLRHRFK
jgi:hypothetical protein